MQFLNKFFFYVFAIFLTVASFPTFADKPINIPILCYHNLSAVRGSMNMTPERFESQIKWLKDNGFTIIPLKEAVEYLEGKRESLPSKAIVVTADDGWKSVYTYMLPIVKKHQIPVTLFIYPGTISEGKNALTWNELIELRDTGFFDVQGHTYSHPNFKQQRKRLSQEKYAKFVELELVKSKKILEEKLGNKVTLLAWPFGIYDAYLEVAASNAGYQMAFSIDARDANRSFRPMSQPRFMIIDALSTKTFQGIAKTAS